MASASGLRVTGLSSHRALPSLIATTHQPRPLLSSEAFNASFDRPLSNISRASKKTRIEKHGPDLKEFMQKVGGSPVGKIFPEPQQFVDPSSLRGDGLKVFLDVYGCQMNVADAEVVLGILEEQGYSRTLEKQDADIWLLLTCSIREGAEDKIWRKLHHIETSRQHRRLKGDLVVGVLGCMAERVKAGLLSHGVTSVVAGPDSYRDLPRLLSSQRLTGQAAINVLLSLQETYSGVTPVRLHNSVSAYVSIQRGCDNMCSYCIVPHTRGRERSRPIQSILEEVRLLRESGVREITLLGQNVNSYRDTSAPSSSLYPGASTAPGFSTVYKPRKGGLSFAHLLDQVSEANPDIRIRFTAPHPKDFPVELLDLIGERENVCKQLHLPAQSGSTKVLAAMNRGYSRESYLALVDTVKSRLPGIALTSDFIVGFCGETEEDFQETVDLVKEVDYHKAFMYPYSMREKTAAHRKLEDTVPEHVKAERHLRLKEVYRDKVMILHRSMHDSVYSVLVTGDSKKSPEDLQGLTDNGVKVIFSKSNPSSCPKPGDLVPVQITGSSSEVVHGKLVT